MIGRLPFEEVLEGEGYSLIELLMAVAVISVLTFASLDLFTDNINETKFEQTRQQLERIKTAILGDPSIRENNVRTSFGYVGDMGGLPSALSSLVTQGAQTAYSAPTATTRIGAGWNGPYLATAVGSVNVATDAWGNALSITLGASTATITSYGSNGTSDPGVTTGFSQDITASIAATDWRGVVYGYIHTDGIPYTGTGRVTLYTADGAGAINTATPSTVTLTSGSGGSQGYFSFSNVPFGKRSIKIEIPYPTPTATVGPIVFTMDRPNLELPDSVLDTNP